MEITNALASTTNTAAPESKAEKDLAGLANDFNNFLTLLTTQLRYQDPLEPMDSNEFVSQLVQFTGVEQSIKTNKNLEELLALQNTNSTTGALNYIGKSVEAQSNVLSLNDGKAEISYGLAVQATSTRIIVRNGAGEAIASFTGETAPGKHSFVWDGKDFDGAQLPDGAYRFVVNAEDSEKQKIETATAAIARVTGVETTKDGLMLSLGAALVPVASVIAIRETPPVDSGT